MSFTSPGMENVLFMQSTQRPAAGCSSCTLPATLPLPDAVVTLSSERGACTMRLTSCSAAGTTHTVSEACTWTVPYIGRLLLTLLSAGNHSRHAMRTVRNWDWGGEQ
jgi:hypothetical protein